MSYQSVNPPLQRKSITQIQTGKGNTPIVVLTAYTAPMARIADAHADIVLVGDSLGMVLYGLESTLPVSLEMMIAHGAAVVRSTKQACVVVDLPFGSYQASPEEAFASCARLMKETGCQAVKLEGGVEMAPTIAFLAARGVPVMAHVGLTPQYVNVLGGYRYRGRGEAERARIRADAEAVAQAGAFSMVLEGVEEALAREITGAVVVPTIGIGASAACDGQVLVTEDMVGLTPAQPRFVKKYASVGETIEQAVAQYAQEVRARAFPTMSHCFLAKE